MFEKKKKQQQHISKCVQSECSKIVRTMNTENVDQLFCDKFSILMPNLC